MSEPQDVPDPEKRRYVEELGVLSSQLLHAVSSEAAAQFSKERLQKDPAASDEARFAAASTYREAQASATALREKMVEVHLRYLQDHS